MRTILLRATAVVLLAAMTVVVAGCGRRADADAPNNAMNPQQKAIIARHKQKADSE